MEVELLNQTAVYQTISALVLRSLMSKYLLYIIRYICKHRHSIYINILLLSSDSASAIAMCKALLFKIDSALASQHCGAWIKGYGFAYV